MRGYADIRYPAPLIDLLIQKAADEIEQAGATVAAQAFGRHDGRVEPSLGLHTR